MVTMTEFVGARARYQQCLRDEPHITRVRYGGRLGRMILSLSSGAWSAVRPEDAQGLGEATVEQLKPIEITPSKFGIEFTRLDVQFELSSLLAGRFCSRRWMAQRLGAAGGAVKSEAKAAAARANGRLGGTSKKQAARKPPFVDRALRLTWNHAVDCFPRVRQESQPCLRRYPTDAGSGYG